MFWLVPLLHLYCYFYLNRLYHFSRVLSYVILVELWFIEALLVFPLHLLWLIRFPAGIYRLKVNNRNTRTRCEISLKLTIKIPAGIYLLKVNNRNTRTRCEICLKLTIKIKIPCSSVSIVNFEHAIAGWVMCNIILQF